MTNIVLADDHDLFIEGLTLLLESESDLQLSFIASDGKALLNYLEHHTADVILLDINMPIIDGIEAAQYIVEHYPKIKIIMLTMFDKPVIIEKLIEIGVHGYLLKNTSKAELVRSIQAVSIDQMYFAPEVTLKILAQQKQMKAETIHLTKREKEILELICEGLKTLEIAEKLFLSKFTIDSHRKNILSKTGCKNATQLQNWARNKDLII